MNHKKKWKCLAYFMPGMLLMAVLFIHQGCSKKSAEASTENSGTTTDTLKKEIQLEGTGATATEGDAVTVHYTGFLMDGTKFDSSLDHGQPFTFTLGEHRVIPGWEQGLLGTKEGSIIVLTIPPDLAYGASGAGGRIPPNATLRFEIQVLKVQPAAQ